MVSRRALLILPPPQKPLTLSNTKNVYGPMLDGFFQQQQKLHLQACLLDVAVMVPLGCCPTSFRPRATIFEEAQKVLALVYSLISAIATKNGVDIAVPGALGLCIFYLVAKENCLTKTDSSDTCSPSCFGPFVSVPTLVDAGRVYNVLCSSDKQHGNEVVQGLLDQYQSKSEPKPTVTTLPVQDSGSHEKEEFAPSSSPEAQVHLSIAVGGAFDHLHVGHKLLLTATALLAEPKGTGRNSSQTVKLAIGISGDEMLANKQYAEEMETWNERQEKVAEFLESVLLFSAPVLSAKKVESFSDPTANGRRVRTTYGSELIVEYVQLFDPFGPTITDQNISALVLSKETRSGGDGVNERRQKLGWPPLEIFEVDVLDTNPDLEDDRRQPSATASFQSKVSSTEIRRQIHEKNVSPG